MLYVERDDNGKIIGVHTSPTPKAVETKPAVDEELIDFLAKTTGNDPRKLQLSLTDMGMIRLVEDLVELLIQKNIILYTDLPEYAQRKIHERKRLREEIACQTLTVDDIL